MLCEWKNDRLLCECEDERLLCEWKMRDCYAMESVENEILQMGSQNRMDVEDERVYLFLPNHLFL